MPYRLGKNLPVVDARTMRFSSYLTSALPSAPPSVDYGTKVSTWPMYYNDQYGDCTCAAAGHLIQNWTANAGSEITPPDPAVLSFYEHFVGTPPPADEGCAMLSVLKYWRKTGLNEHKVTAFASVELRNHAEAMNAMYLLGGIYIGVALPDSSCHRAVTMSRSRGWYRRGVRWETPRPTRKMATAFLRWVTTPRTSTWSPGASSSP
jgi:hypothetical protein